MLTRPDVPYLRVLQNTFTHTCYSIIAPTLLARVSDHLRGQVLNVLQVLPFPSPHWFLGVYTHGGIER